MTRSRTRCLTGIEQRLSTPLPSVRSINPNFPDYREVVIQRCVDCELVQSFVSATHAFKALKDELQTASLREAPVTPVRNSIRA